MRLTPEQRKTLVQATRDALLVSGAALVSLGAWMVYPPAGVIVAGALLLVGGLRGSR